ncbi:hypothetical protein FBU59_001124 [Linderina macrospora]|uniref:Uncharacterized protein n=1 Tax=Linderina macrospora TaxID=4868 RepID=A0ACC1JEY1_9FUNG|nr:hypothetical protein FBU59_001124 [Linderina macrospora]
MHFTAPTAQFGKTVVLAYPDTTRLGGYRAALGLWRSLGGDDSTLTKGQIDAAPEETVETQVSATDSEHIGVLIGTPPVPNNGATFVFVNGLPAAEHIPVFVDTLLAQFEASDVEKVVVVSSANLSGVKGGGSERLFALTGLQGLPEISAGACTGDAMLSALDTLGRVSSLEMVVAVHGDKRPAEFGSEFADEDDGRVVAVLGGVLAKAVAPGAAGVEVTATRVKCGGEKAVQGLPAFG